MPRFISVQVARVKKDLLTPEICELCIVWQNDSKKDVPEDFDIDMGAPETEKAAVAIQSQFRKFQKKKQDDKS
ncbi:Purkinje cell protein 4 [Acipenser ruthenus]|uniref:Purkinje cell protein 4 n=1 Tax=Acipenser ruthenus TaxID=7906 RepID=A0A444V739_ACIRT|nr:Purkinje cell protein 4 [Acipenser ruthenus]